MSSRCRCCDIVLFDYELRRSKEDGSPEDFCGPCLKVVRLDLEDLLQDRDYAFGSITENVLSLAGYDFNADLQGKTEDF